MAPARPPSSISFPARCAPTAAPSRLQAGRSHCCRRTASRSAASRGRFSWCASFPTRAAWRTSWPALPSTRSRSGAPRPRIAPRALLSRVGARRQDGHAGSAAHLHRPEAARARAGARARPVVLLLDEWLAGLNPTELQVGIALVTMLREEGLTIIIVEHVMDAIRSLCDRCVVMNAGRKIAEGPPAAVLADREVIRAYLGERRCLRSATSRPSTASIARLTAFRSMSGAARSS